MNSRILIAIFFPLLLLAFIALRPATTQAETSLEGYCKDGYYYFPGETTSCSRAPNCGGYGYDELNTADKMPNPQACMGDRALARGQGGCAGYVPACCYEVARTGDYTKCIGYWERLWCAPSQCETAKQRGASDSQCGGSCQCGHAYGHYCGDAPVIPVDQRLGKNKPTPTVTVAPTAKPGIYPTVIPTSIPTVIPTAMPTVAPTPTPAITSYITPVPQQVTFVPKGIVFITNNQGLLLRDIQLTLTSIETKATVQTVHYTNNPHGTPIHFILLPVPQGEYSLYVTAKSHDGVMYRQSGTCNNSLKKGTCIIANGDPVIVEIKINQLINIAQINENIKRTLDKQKQSMVAAKKMDTVMEQKINNWFLNLIERILGR